MSAYPVPVAAVGRRGFIRLLAMGWTHTAAARIAAVPDSEVDRVVTLAYLVSNRIGMAK